MGKLKSQAVGEHVIFMTAIVAALVGMQVYFTRSLQGRHKYYTDYMAMGAEPFSGAHSNYKRIAELLPFDSERTVKNPDVDDEEQYFSFEEDIGWIRRGKGNKDRPFIVPQKIMAECGIPRSCRGIL